MNTQRVKPKERGSAYHLRRANDWFAGEVGARNHHLLREKNLGRRNLHAEVAARDHDAVRLGENLAIVLDALVVLDL